MFCKTQKSILAIEFAVTLCFFSHWHKLIPQNIDYCERRGLYRWLENISLILLRNTQYWPRELQEKFSRERLIRLLRTVPQKNPITISKHNLTDYFLALPVMTREQLKKCFAQAIHSRQQEEIPEPLLLASTSGTSGTPMQVGVTKQIETRYRIIRRRLFEFASIKSNDEFIYPRTKLNPHFCDKNLYIRNDLDALVETLKEFFDVIYQKKVQAIYAFPSLLILFAEKIAQMNMPTPPLKAIFVAGEEFSTDSRRLIETSFQAPVFNFYASIELSSIGQECLEHDGLHINPEFHYVEILSENDVPLGFGYWGRIVITVLDYSLVPIVRYDTGDIGMLINDPCPCGRMLPRLKIQGRKLEMIETPRGVISPHAFKEIIEACDTNLNKISRYQLVVQDNLLTLVVVPTKHFSHEDARSLENLCKQFIGNKIEFELKTAASVSYVGAKAPLLIRGGG